MKRRSPTEDILGTVLDDTPDFHHLIDSNIISQDSGTFSHPTTSSQPVNDAFDLLVTDADTVSNVSYVASMATNQILPSDMSEVDDVLSIRKHEQNALGIDFLTMDLHFDVDHLVSPDMIPIPSNPDEIPLPNEMTTRPSSPMDDRSVPNTSFFHAPIPANRTVVQMPSSFIRHPKASLPLPSNQADDNDLEQFLSMNRQLQKLYSDQITQMRRRRVSIQSDMIKVRSRLDAYTRRKQLTSSMRIRETNKQKPGQTLTYFQKPYFFDRKTRSSPYENYEVTQTQSDGTLLSFRNALNEKDELLFPFRPSNISEGAMNYKQDALFKRIVRKEIQFKLKMGLKESVVAQAEAALQTSRHQFTKGQIDVAEFTHSKQENVKTTKKRLASEITKISGLSDGELFHQITDDKLNWTKIAGQIRSQSRSLNVKHKSRYTASDVAVIGEETTRDDIQPKVIELAWKNRLHPAIDQKKFTKHEITQITILREEYEKSWIDIAKALSSQEGEKRRTPLQCMTAYQKNILSSTLHTCPPHSRIEKFKLASLIASNEPIVRSNYLDYFKGRTRHDFFRRRITWGYKKQLGISERVNGPFSDEEDAQLLTFLLADESSDRISDTVLEHFEHANRTEIEIRYRLYCLNSLMEGRVAHWRVLTKLFDDSCAAGHWISSITKSFPSLLFQSVTRNIILFENGVDGPARRQIKKIVAKIKAKLKAETSGIEALVAKLKSCGTSTLQKTVSEMISPTRSNQTESAPIEDDSDLGDLLPSHLQLYAKTIRHLLDRLKSSDARITPLEDMCTYELSSELVHIFRLPAVLNAVGRGDVNSMKKSTIYKSLLRARTKQPSDTESLLKLKF